MNDHAENRMLAAPRQGPLAAALRDVKNALADRDDVVIEMREAQRMRLELLALELQPVIAEVPADIPLFDFAVSAGLQPRLWIDAVAHVDMGRDRRTYRFVRDTRMGRVVLAESADMRPVAEQVTRYVAERLVERQRLMDGAAMPAGQSAPVPAGSADVASAPVAAPIAVQPAVAPPAEPASAAHSMATNPSGQAQDRIAADLAETRRRWLTFLGSLAFAALGIGLGTLATLLILNGGRLPAGWGG